MWDLSSQLEINTCMFYRLSQPGPSVCLFFNIEVILMKPRRLEQPPRTLSSSAYRRLGGFFGPVLPLASSLFQTLLLLF